MKGWHVENWLHKTSHSSTNDVTHAEKATVLINTKQSVSQKSLELDLLYHHTDKIMDRNYCNSFRNSHGHHLEE